MTYAHHAEPQMPFAETLTVRELAEKLGTTPDMIRLLVREGYSEVVERHISWRRTIVRHPPKHLLRWLTNMFRPIHERPLIQLEELVPILRMKFDDIEKLCKFYGIELQHSQTFGPLISTHGFEMLVLSLPDSRVVRFDRISILQYICREKLGFQMRRKIVPYSMQLEREISRISHLPEPSKTVRASALWEAFKDARTVAAALSQYRHEVYREEVDKAWSWLSMMMNRLTDGMRGSEVRRQAGVSQLAGRLLRPPVDGNHRPPTLHGHSEGVPHEDLSSPEVNEQPPDTDRPQPS